MTTLHTPHSQTGRLHTRRLLTRPVTAAPDRTPPLHVAVVAPPWFSVPPDGYGGIEAMLGGLVDGLVDRGHRVTLIGAGPNGTRADRFVAVYEEPPSERLGEPMPEVLHAAVAARVLSELDVDVVHDNTLAGPLAARGYPAPTVVTAHGPVTGEAGRLLGALGDSVELVAISDAQRQDAPHLNWVGRVHNGIDVASHPVGEGADGYLLWLGRFSPAKGAHLAIDTARAAGMPLVLAGKLSEQSEHDYFEEAIRPRLGPGVCYVGAADAEMKRELYGAASALLFPITWDEPFGLVMVEAMACGTPVVALGRGSVPEVVEDGVTGFVVDHPDDLLGAVRRVDELDRAACRRRTEELFDHRVMVDGYERIFRQVADVPVSSVARHRSA
ncbi:glycosyltransferase family 4 protein [Nocardioides pocheonensis]|uniref:glycosyltransferase family 4 protein n=1 Tax=Nocardioides pocheonensis TaxID=661485 RepID=UPI00161E2C48|nr:glycosyltransferase family 4 protein [Nocardioides pocheonensis]